MFGFEHVQFNWRDALDIALVSLLVFQVVKMLRGSRAMAVLTGLGVLAILHYFANAHGLYTLYWLLQYIFSSIFILIVVIFQADIRQALGEMGSSGRLFGKDNVTDDNIEIIAEACAEMAQKRIGALIVIEKSMRLGDMLQQEGVRLDAILSRELLLNLFYPKAPLHDGAVIISRGKIMAAGCILPLAVAQGQNFGTRHRAALGISGESDAVVVVVSEERGEISIALRGNLIRSLDRERLISSLRDIFARSRFSFWHD